MGNENSKAIGESQAYNTLVPTQHQSWEGQPPFDANEATQQSAYAKGESQAGRRDGGTGAFAKATHQNWTGAAFSSKAELSVATQGSSRALASAQGTAVTVGDSAAMARTKRAPPIPNRSSVSNNYSSTSLVRRATQSSTTLVTRNFNNVKTAVSLASPPPLSNALVATQGDASAMINTSGHAEAKAKSRTGSAHIFKDKNDFVVESHGTGQAGMTGNTMWAIDGGNMAMTHLESANSGAIFCPCSLRKDGEMCDCPCHGGKTMNHDTPANRRGSFDRERRRNHGHGRYHSPQPAYQ